MDQMKIFIDMLHFGNDPFSSYDFNPDDVDAQGWNSDHYYLTNVIKDKAPISIAEIGVWKGGSVLTMAKALREFKINGAIVAIDTFRGSPEHWIQSNWWDEMKVRGGEPNIYNNFMANVISESLEDFVIPFPVDSYTAYKVFSEQNALFDLIHIDAGHEYESVSKDLELWSTLLKENATIIMDDYCWDDEKNKPYSWPGVAKAVQEFVNKKSDKVLFEHGDGKALISFKE